MLGHVKGPSWSSLPCSSRSTTPAQVAARYGVHRSWIYKLKARYDAVGEAAFEAQSRRPRTSRNAIPAATVEAIVRLRKELSGDGLDAGPDTIAWHLEHHHSITVSVSTIARTLTRAQLVEPEPKKRPKSSYIRFAADLPNELWQSDFTHYRLADGTELLVLHEEPGAEPVRGHTGFPGGPGGDGHGRRPRSAGDDSTAEW